MEESSCKPLNTSSNSDSSSICLFFLSVVVVSRRGSNPIIFARTETTHFPPSLLQAQKDTALNDVVYQAKEDGSLKQTPLPTIEEEEEVVMKKKEEKQKEPSSFKVL